MWWNFNCPCCYSELLSLYNLQLYNKFAISDHDCLLRTIKATTIVTRPQHNCTFSSNHPMRAEARSLLLNRNTPQVNWMIQWTAKWHQQQTADTPDSPVIQNHRLWHNPDYWWNAMMQHEHINWHHMWWESQLSSRENTFQCLLLLIAVICDNTTILLTMLSECDSERTAEWFRVKRRQLPWRYSQLIMIEGESPVIQALLGTLLTWGLTLAGAAMALFLQVF